MKEPMPSTTSSFDTTDLSNPDTSCTIQTVQEAAVKEFLHPIVITAIISTSARISTIHSMLIAGDIASTVRRAARPPVSTAPHLLPVAALSSSRQFRRLFWNDSTTSHHRRRHCPMRHRRRIREQRATRRGFLRRGSTVQRRYHPVEWWADGLPLLAQEPTGDWV